MAIVTKVAKHYAIRIVIVAVMCILFTLWGAYDLWVKIPREIATADRFNAISGQLDAMDERADTLTVQERQTYQALSEEREELAPGGETPERPAKFDKLVCWMFISCILCAPYFFWIYMKARRSVYQLEDDGTLVTPTGRWAADDIADIDMSRWMAKSTAEVVHRDGKREKLDDYIYRNTDKIVGTLAARLYPQQWGEDAKPIKKSEEDKGENTSQG